jgi:hypothetical protein
MDLYAVGVKIPTGLDLTGLDWTDSEWDPCFTVSSLRVMKLDKTCI